METNHGRKGANGLERRASDPADRLAAMVARQNPVARGKHLDRHLCAGGKRDHRAAGKGDAQKIRQARIIRRLFHPQERVVGRGGHGRQGQHKAAAIGQGQHQKFDPIPFLAHQRIARLKPDRIAGPAHGRPRRHFLATAAAAGQHQPPGLVIGVKVIDVAGTDLCRTHQAITLCGTVADKEIIG